MKSFDTIVLGVVMIVFLIIAPKLLSSDGLGALLQKLS